MNHTLLSIIFTGILSIVVNSSAQANQTPQITGAGISYGMEQNTPTPDAVLSPVRDHHHHWRGRWWGEPIIVDPACTEVCTHWGCHWVCDDY